MYCSRPVIGFCITTIAIITILYGCTKNDVGEDCTHNGWIISEACNGYAGFYFTPNEGFEWNRLGIPGLMYDVALNDMAIMTGSSVWLCGPVYEGYGLLLFASQNGYTLTRVGTQALLNNINLKLVTIRNSQDVWIGGTHGFCAYSLDVGESWFKIPFDSLGSVTWNSLVCAGNDSLWLIGNVDNANDSTSIICLFSGTNGLIWQPCTSQLFFGNECTKLLAINDSILLMSSTRGLLRSKNGGNDWELVFNSTEDPITSCLAPEINDYWFTTAHGLLYHSNDTGLTWTNQKPHPAGIPLTDICICYPNRIWISASDTLVSHKGAILYSRDLGKNWFIQDIPGAPPVRKIGMIAANH
jgi:photosystem II stability/assembly factor-like uncharacterized protein